VAPPKRKTGGRVTAPGTRPSTGSKPAAKARSGGAADAHHESGRYTAPTSKAMLESPPWVPILMLALFAVGALAIMARYLWWDSNIPMVVGMACLLGGLFTATRWR
jgi:hypothetical protein